MQYFALLISQERNLTTAERTAVMTEFEEFHAKARRAIRAGPRLARTNLVASVRADLLRRAGRRAEALTWYRNALQLNGSAPSRDFLRRRITECGG